MPPCTIVIVALNDRLMPLATSVMQRLETAWEGPREATFRVVAAGDFDEKLRSSIDAVIFVEDEQSASGGVSSLLMALEESGLPLLALSTQEIAKNNPYEFAGVKVSPLDTEDRILISLLDGLMHRQPQVERLRDEGTLAQRLHGGLRTEITKMHEELQLAAMVQREYLPSEIPSLHGVSFDALWRPAHYVSGDIFDVARLDDDHIGVFLADAAGHGVPAALMTMVICRALETREVEHGMVRLLPPSVVLGRLNDGMIRRQGQSARFATAVYALINCRTRVMQIAGAGHPPPKLIHADGTTDEISTPGGLLGVFEGETYQQCEIQLQVDDRMLLFTDGFEQAFPETAQSSDEHRLPTERYHSEFDAIARLLEPVKMIEAIKQRLNDESGSLHQVDDLTLICMRVAALAEADGSPPQSSDASTPISMSL